MIASLRGEILEVDEDSVLLETGGVGYQVFVPLNAAPGRFVQGEEVFLYTHLSVREDLWQLFGFLTRDEVTLFRYFINVGGIGGKTALAILSAMTPDQAAAAILGGDPHPFELVSGIGKKTAQRIVLELKDKVAKMSLNITAASFAQTPSPKGGDGDAVLALVQLGYSARDAKKAVVQIVSEDVAASTEEVIKKALHLLSKF